MHVTDAVRKNAFTVLKARDITSGDQFHGTAVGTAAAHRCQSCSMRKPGWFCDLRGEALAEMEAMSVTVTLPVNGILFSEGQPSAKVAIVCEGRLKLTRSSPQGKTLLVRIAKAGEVLGLSAALSNQPYELSAEAIEPVLVRMVERKNFVGFLERHGESSLRAAENLSREYRAVMSDTYRLALSSSIAGRVAHLLLEFAHDGDSLENAQPEIHMSLKHEDLAFKLGSSRESVTRVLNDLKREGILSIKGTRMVLLKKEALERLV